MSDTQEQHEIDCLIYDFYSVVVALYGKPKITLPRWRRILQLVAGTYERQLDQHLDLSMVSARVMREIDGFNGKSNMEVSLMMEHFRLKDQLCSAGYTLQKVDESAQGIYAYRWHDPDGNKIEIPRIEPRAGGFSA